MKNGVPEIAPSIRATCADCVRSSSAILATRGIGASTLRTDSSPFPRRIAEPTGRVQRQSLGDVLGVAIDDAPQLTRPGEHASDAAPWSRSLVRRRRRRLGWRLAHPGRDRAGLVSGLHPGDLPGACCSSAASILANRSVISSNWRVSSDSDWAVKRRRLLSTSEAVTDAVITARKPIPASITTVAMNRPTDLLGRDVPIPHGGDRLQREPEAPADRRILLMVEHPLQNPARHRDHHRERGDDPRRPARGQRVMEQQACRQRHLPGAIYAIRPRQPEPRDARPRWSERFAARSLSSRLSIGSGRSLSSPGAPAG